jgi:uncharacterized protein
LRRAVVLLIRLWQAVLSPHFGGCRHVPSCSEYAREAVERHGVARGGRLALGRLLRCRPLGSHGFDPVP